MNHTYPGAPAIAWVDQGTIEFMDFAFTSGDASYIRRLVAHEAAHFLWHHILTEDTQSAFMALSGWTQTPLLEAVPVAATSAEDHPKAGGGVIEEWYRTTNTNFVSAYAAVLNPDEDFAETLSYYIYEPDLVRGIAPGKCTYS